MTMFITNDVLKHMFYTSVVFGPGLQPQYLPHVCQHGRPALYPETAAREQPEHCRFYSQNLNRGRSKAWKNNIWWLS